MSRKRETTKSGLRRSTGRTNKYEESKSDSNDVKSENEEMDEMNKIFGDVETIPENKTDIIKLKHLKTKRTRAAFEEIFMRYGEEANIECGDYDDLPNRADGKHDEESSSDSEASIDLNMIDDPKEWRKINALHPKDGPILSKSNVHISEDELNTYYRVMQRNLKNMGGDVEVDEEGFDEELSDSQVDIHQDNMIDENDDDESSKDDERNTDVENGFLIDDDESPGSREETKSDSQMDIHKKEGPLVVGEENYDSENDDESIDSQEVIEKDCDMNVMEDPLGEDVECSDESSENEGHDADFVPSSRRKQHDQSSFGIRQLSPIPHLRNDRHYRMRSESMRDKSLPMSRMSSTGLFQNSYNCDVHSETTLDDEKVSQAINQLQLDKSSKSKIRVEESSYSAHLDQSQIRTLSKSKKKIDFDSSPEENVGHVLEPATRKRNQTSPGNDKRELRSGKAKKDFISLESVSPPPKPVETSSLSQKRKRKLSFSKEIVASPSFTSSCFSKSHVKRMLSLESVEPPKSRSFNLQPFEVRHRGAKSSSFMSTTVTIDKSSTDTNIIKIRNLGSGMHVSRNGTVEDLEPKRSRCSDSSASKFNFLSLASSVLKAPWTDLDRAAK